MFTGGHSYRAERRFWCFSALSWQAVVSRHSGCCRLILLYSTFHLKQSTSPTIWDTVCDTNSVFLLFTPYVYSFMWILLYFDEVRHCTLSCFSFQLRRDGNCARVLNEKNFYEQSIICVIVSDTTAATLRGKRSSSECRQVHLARPSSCLRHQTSNAPLIIFPSKIISNWQTLRPQNWKLVSQAKENHFTHSSEKEEKSFSHMTHTFLHAEPITHTHTSAVSQRKW